nr:MAG TPA: hypothetical protein [Caudoviricetes sp.]
MGELIQYNLISIGGNRHSFHFCRFARHATCQT